MILIEESIPLVFLTICGSVSGWVGVGGVGLPCLMESCVFVASILPCLHHPTSLHYHTLIIFCLTTIPEHFFASPFSFPDLPQDHHKWPTTNVTYKCNHYVFSLPSSSTLIFFYPVYLPIDTSKVCPLCLIKPSPPIHVSLPHIFYLLLKMRMKGRQPTLYPHVWNAWRSLPLRGQDFCSN